MVKQNDQVRVLDPTEMISGLTQAQLGDEWWKTIYAIPLEDHFGVFDDQSDPRGRRGSVEKAFSAQFDESVLFLGGAFGERATGVGTDGVARLERTVVMPNQGSGTVFFPMLNGEYDNLTESETGGGLSVEELRDKAKADFNSSTSTTPGLVSKLFAAVDGVRVKNPLAYRQASTAPFSFTTPFPTSGSLLSTIGYNDTTYLRNAGEAATALSDLASGGSVTIGPAVADGYWLGLDIAGGDHVLDFGGTLETSDGSFFFSLDITYNVLNPLYGGSGNDAITGTIGKDFIAGMNGGDSLYGRQGDDLLEGGDGDDVIDGGIGNDELWGDEGMDTFVYNRGYGKDVIYDFAPGETVRISGARAIPGINTILMPSGASAVQVDFGGQNTLTLVGVQEAAIRVDRGLITYV